MVFFVFLVLRPKRINLWFNAINFDFFSLGLSKPKKPKKPFKYVYFNISKPKKPKKPFKYVYSHWNHWFFIGKHIIVMKPLHFWIELKAFQLHECSFQRIVLKIYMIFHTETIKWLLLSRREALGRSVDGTDQPALQGKIVFLLF